MSPEKSPISPNTHERTPITLNDLVQQSEKLYKDLLILSETDDPAAFLGGIIEIPSEKESVTLHSGGRTFFFDTGKTKNNRGYLKITETHIEGVEKKPVRNSVVIFENQLSDFYIALSRLILNLQK